jgi:hypothetical protein
LVSADNVVILVGSVHAIKKNTEAIAVARKEVGKGKAVPLQAWSGPESSRKLRFPDFMTTAQTGVEVNDDKTNTWSCWEIRIQDEVTI